MSTTEQQPSVEDTIVGIERIAARLDRERRLSHVVHVFALFCVGGATATATRLAHLEPALAILIGVGVGVVITIVFETLARRWARRHASD